MKIASVILNTILMCVFAFAGSSALMKLENDIGYSQNPVHTSLTLCVGITLFVLFALAGIVPYIPIVLGG